MSEVFLLGEFDGSLVVIPRQEARRLAALHDALQHSGTWGEFLARTVQDEDTRDYLASQFDDLPSSDDAFDPEALPGFGDGWPTWPRQAMLDWLPASVQALGVVRDTLLSGPLLQIPEGLREDVIKALATEGVECRQDEDDLVTRACGAWMYA